jgi:flagellar basal body P-ring protein FlgI
MWAASATKSGSDSSGADGMEARSMWRFHPRRVAAFALGAMVLVQSSLVANPFGGDDDMKPKLKVPKKPEIPLKIDETIGDLAKVPPLTEVQVEGVGLVVGLDGTGSDPGISAYRTKLLDQMRKAGVHNAEKYLASGNTSLVIVKGRIPAGITNEDVFDVKVELDSGSTTTSLAGGQLMKAELFLLGFGSKGEVLPNQGKKLAEAYGPVMPGNPGQPDDPKSGLVLGGARVKDDLPYVLVINEKRKSFRTSALLQALINARFSQLRGVDKEGMAKAKTDQSLSLRIPRNYHHNQYRYFQVVENLPVIDTPALRAARLKSWGAELLDPKTTGAAAIRLEGMGRNASDTLKLGLANAHPQVRFFAAEALAYLGDEAGVDVLSDAAKNRPEFRAYALAALAAMDQPASSIRLKELMSCPDPDVRYGAFNSLRIIDRDDPCLGRVQVREDPPEPESGNGDALAMRIASPRRKAARRADPFELYVVDSEGPPLVHLARTRRCEIVLFGKGQKLQTPLVLSAGPILVNASDGDDHAQVSRVATLAGGGADQKLATGLQVAEVIRQVANLGATYPEILSLLQAADRQRNLPVSPASKVSLVVDALPAALAAYEEAQVAGKDATSKSDPALERTATVKGKDKTPRKSLTERIFRRGDK